MNAVLLASSPETKKMDISSRRDPEVPARSQGRRRFTADFKRQIVREADACTEPGSVGALLRREGLYASHLTEWRRLVRAAEKDALAPQKRGPKFKTTAADEETKQLRREVERLKLDLKKAEAICEIQKKLSALLGITLDSQDPTEST
jgi:transposase